MATKKKLNIAANGTSNVLSASDIFSRGTSIAVRTEIPEIGGAIMIRAINAKDVVEFIGTQTDDAESRQMAMVTLIQKTVVNPDGSPMFPSDEDVEKLRNLRFPVFTAIAAAVNEVAGLTKREASVEELGKD